jgi:hypothetical protein
LNASDEWKVAFVAAILGEGQIAKPASHPESQGIANLLSDMAKDLHLARRIRKWAKRFAELIRKAARFGK